MCKVGNLTPWCSLTIVLLCVPDTIPPSPTQGQELEGLRIQPSSEPTFVDFAGTAHCKTVNVETVGHVNVFGNGDCNQNYFAEFQIASCPACKCLLLSTFMPTIFLMGELLVAVQWYLKCPG